MTSAKETKTQADFHCFDASIFREYDIRGVVGDTLHAQDAYFIGRAFATRAAAAQPDGFICVGRDGRLSSPELTQALCRGITESGMRVLDIGLGPTPMLYYAAYTMNAAGAVMVTGSHNPKDHNGFKFVLGNGPFYGADILALRSLAESGMLAKGQGEVESRDVFAAYVDKLLSAYVSGRKLRVAWDAGNGATGEVMEALCRKLPGEHILLNAAIDGTFPSHHPDPTVPENMQQLIAAVRAHKLDLGIAFDGDGDRIGVVDGEGEILWGDQLLMLYAKEVLRARPGATIIADVKASSALFEEVARLGGKPLMWKTGHSLIKAKMLQTQAPLAGEMSGHLFFADSYFGYDDGLYAAVRLLLLLADGSESLAALRKKLPRRVNTPEIRFPCDDARKFGIIDEVKERLSQARAEFSDVDGVRVSTPDGWWLLRASNTQPVLVARCESADEAGLARLKEALSAQLRLSHVELP